MRPPFILPGLRSLRELRRASRARRSDLVIPGRRASAGPGIDTPQSFDLARPSLILFAAAYGFRVRSLPLAPRNDGSYSANAPPPLFFVRPGAGRLPFSIFSPKNGGMERREGARGLRGPFGQPLRSGRPRALRGRAPACEAGCAPLALHSPSVARTRARLTAVRIVGAPALPLRAAPSRRRRASAQSAGIMRPVRRPGITFFVRCYCRIFPDARPTG